MCRREARLHYRYVSSARTHNTFFLSLIDCCLNMYSLFLLVSLVFLTEQWRGSCPLVVWLGAPYSPKWHQYSIMAVSVWGNSNAIIVWLSACFFPDKTCDMFNSFHDSNAICLWQMALLPWKHSDRIYKHYRYFLFNLFIKVT